MSGMIVTLLGLLLANPTTRPTTAPIEIALPARDEPAVVAELRRKYDLDTNQLRARRDARLRALEGSTAPPADLERARKLILDQFTQSQRDLDVAFSEARWRVYEQPGVAVPSVAVSGASAQIPPATQPTALPNAAERP